ncbi:MAG TPA: VOC family protein [Kofleriaceae bacterium]|nr:VOC family protein [Kofleriaceae bacterium]
MARSLQFTPLVSSVIRHDLMCVDPRVAERFYGELFGWETLEIRVKGFAMKRLALGERVLGAILPFDPGHGVSSHWIPYIQVADVDASCERVTELGGDVCVAPADIPPGRFAVVNDPTEALFSPFVPRSLPAWAADAAPVGAFAWDELRTDDPDAARAFYTELLGWTANELGGTTILSSDELPVASIVAMPERTTHAPMWIPYIKVDDPERIAIRATKLGAHLRLSPTEDPTLGTIAILRDPTGAYFGVGDGLSVQQLQPATPRARSTRDGVLIPRSTRAAPRHANARRR